MYSIWDALPEAQVDKLLLFPSLQTLRQRCETGTGRRLRSVDQTVQARTIPLRGYVSDEEEKYNCSATPRRWSTNHHGEPFAADARRDAEPHTTVGQQTQPEVMKDHCRLSGAALWYDNGRRFRSRKLHRLLSVRARRAMSERALPHP